MLDIQQIPVLNDNYIYLIHDPESQETAVVDPALAEPVLNVLKQKNWQLNYILNTHHHGDHIGGNLALKKKTQCKIVGSATDQQRIPGIDISLSEGDIFKLGNYEFQVISCSGHTIGHIAFYQPEAKALFCGDTLFAIGCGRLFEGSAEQMLQSLKKFSSLPLDTKVYCAHEYTAANAQFALSVEPENTNLLKAVERIKQLRENNLPTVPTTLEQEQTTNPFLRTDSPDIQQTLAMQGASELAVFTELRLRKNRF